MNIDSNTNINMYSLPSVYGNIKSEIELPNNMYKMPLIYGNCSSLKTTNSDCNALNNGSNNGTKSETNLLLNKEDFKDNELALIALKDLISRQQLLFSRVENLEKNIDSRLALKTNTNSLQEIKPKEYSNVSKDEMKAKTSLSPSKTVKDIVIFANPKQIPISIFAVINAMKSLGLKVLLNIHSHSSLNSCETHLDYLNQILSSIDFNYKTNNSFNTRLENDLIVTIIFKDIEEHQMALSSTDLIDIKSEANILRFMARIAAEFRPQLSSLYEVINDKSRVTLVDRFIDEIHENVFINSINDTKYDLKLDSYLTANPYLTGSTPSIADLFLWSGLHRKTSNPKLWPTLELWFNNIKKFISTQEL